MNKQSNGTQHRPVYLPANLVPDTMSEAEQTVVLRDMSSDELRRLALLAKDSEVAASAAPSIEQIKQEITAMREYQHEPKDADEAATQYLRTRVLRHDVWLNYLSTSGVKFGDTKVYDFLLQLTEDDDREWIDVPVEQLNKSPDLLCVHKKMIYIGDVAVSNRPLEVKAEKRLKYAAITQMFKSSGFQVMEAYFVISQDLANLRSELYDLSELLIKPTGRLPKQLYDSCNSLMDALKDNCTNKAQMVRLISISGSTNVVECPIPDYWPEMEFNPIIPQETEQEIIDHLKGYIDANENSYFDTGYEDAEKAFKTLWEKLGSKDQSSYMKPRATLQVVYNCGDFEQKTGHDLVADYVSDLNNYADESDLRHFILSLLPVQAQLRAMKLKEPNDKHGTFGEWQFKPDESKTPMGKKLGEGLSFNKSHPNDKKGPRAVDPSKYNQCCNTIESMIDYLSQKSDKPSTFQGEWQAKTHEEKVRSADAQRVFNQVCTSNAAQLCLALNSVCQRLNHLPTKLGQKTNIIVPPNGAFLMVMPEGHAVLSDSKCAVPFVTICRYKPKTKVSHLEYQYKLSTNNYDYYVSKLARLPLDKTALWDQVDFTAISTISCFIEITGNTMDELMRRRCIGIITILMLDSHQKTSELLELIKYVSFMPFASASRLSKFILDKMNLMTKTALDIWVLRNLEKFMGKLSKDVVAQKRRVQVRMGKVTDDSYGMEVRLPSFLSDFQHLSVRSYTEEVATLFNIRGKKLYGSQFMDKALTASVDYELTLEEEKRLYGKWITEGMPNKPGEPYPFDAKFAFNASAIVHSVAYVENEYPVDTNKALTDLIASDMNQHMIHSSTLRGSLKEKEERTKPKDFGSTSLDEGLKFLEKTEYDPKLTLTYQIAHDTLEKEDYIAQYSMSEKEQRGGGRPIATPTYRMKAVNMCIERPEQSLGKQYRNNIIVPGLNKLQAQSDAYKRHMQKTIELGNCMLFHATEDQTKFSETDNTLKYGVYLKNSTTMPQQVRKLQYKAMEKMIGREHLTRRMPIDIETDERRPYVNNDGNGIKLKGGWPQGMLNAISTSLHSLCDYYCYYLYKRAFPTDPIVVTGLVHSDDSWMVLSCQDIKVFMRYMLFRIGLKRMFCLKLNDKKFWASAILGELVSNFNNNGDVSIPIMKTINSGTQNLMYQSYPMDMSSQISTLQQLLRNGATNNILIIMWTVLKQQLLKCYNIRNGTDDDKYPIELGGVPGNSAFELALTGVVCHYNTIYQFYTRNEGHPVTQVVRKIMYLSKKVNREKAEEAMIDAKLYTSKYLMTKDDDFEDFNSISLMQRNEVFSAVTQIMPKTKKVARTVARVRAIPFETDGLEMLVTRPKDIKVALGHIKAKLPSILFEFATENYTSSARRMAAVQAIRAKGRNYRLLHSTAVTRQELVDHVSSSAISMSEVTDLKVAFSDDTGIVDIARCTVYDSIIVPNTEAKRFKINKFPNFSSKFDVMGNLKDCLLYGLSKTYPPAEKYIRSRFTRQVLEADFKLIRTRFESFFSVYTPRQACEFIIMMSWDALKARLYVQPNLDKSTPADFITSLYGAIVDGHQCNNVIIDSRNSAPDVISNAIISSIHSAYVLSELYPDVKPIMYAGRDIKTVVDEVDFACLTRHNTVKKAIISLIHGDTAPMDKLYMNNEVSGTWRRAQIKSKSGTWHGPFVWAAHYQGLHMEVSGTPGNVVLVVNEPEVGKILHVMKYFVDTAFRQYSYRDPGAWYQKSEFWVTQTPTSQLKLVSESIIETKIVVGNKYRGLDLFVKPEYKTLVTSDRSTPLAYELDAYNTKVLAVTRQAKVLVARVPQTLSMPNASQIGYEFGYLQGMVISDLMRTNMLMDLTMGRRVTPNPNIIYDILKSASFDFDIVARNFVKNLLNAVTQQEHTLESAESMTGQHDVFTEVLVPITITEYMQTAMVAPEEVEPVDSDEFEVRGGDKREGGFRIVRAILHTICVNEYLDKGEITPVGIVSTYSTFAELVDAVGRNFTEDDIDNIAIRMTTETRMIIFGNNLHDPKIWDFDVAKAITTKLPESHKCKMLLKNAFVGLLDEDRVRRKALNILMGKFQVAEAEDKTDDSDGEEPIDYLDESDDDGLEINYI